MGVLPGRKWFILVARAFLQAARDEWRATQRRVKEYFEGQTLWKRFEYLRNDLRDLEARGMALDSLARVSLFGHSTQNTNSRTSLCYDTSLCSGLARSLL